VKGSKKERKTPREQKRRLGKKGGKDTEGNAQRDREKDIQTQSLIKGVETRSPTVAAKTSRRWRRSSEEKKKKEKKAYSGGGKEKREREKLDLWRDGELNWGNRKEGLAAKRS